MGAPWTSRDERLDHLCDWICPLLIALAWATLVAVTGRSHAMPPTVPGTPALPQSGDVTEILPALLLDVQVASQGWSTN